jgi:hypothetical protein
MKRASARARVRQAQAELAAAELELEKSSRPWRMRLHRHRNAVVLLGGFTGGMALTLLPTHWWTRVGATLGTIAATAARSMLTPAVLGAALEQVRAKPQPDAAPVQD